MTAYSALVDFSDPRQPQGPRLRHAFGTASQHFIATHLHEVRAVLDAVQAAAQQGLWCVGYVRYEAAPAFDAALVAHAPDGPLAWFAVYDQALPWPEEMDAASDAAMQVQWQAPLSRAALDAAMATIQHAIARGELYQVNFTTQMQGLASGVEPSLSSRAGGASGNSSALGLFAALQRAQPGGYAAYIDTGAHGQVLSVSPELFFDWREGAILTRPMKGTAPRGDTPEQDAALAQALQTSPKERAENVMIVDLLRNDLSRIAQPHSVQVPHLFATQALPTVWQMTSDVVARTRAGCTLADVFAALFPCGSVTGAPKVRAMQMIAALEPQPRGVYCGAVGMVQPGGAATFNVPIRTVTLGAVTTPQGLQRFAGQPARCGIGSGITADATAQGEWQEWQHKQVFVHRASSAFSLLETLALVEGTLRDAPAHLERMGSAALHFGYPWQPDHVQAVLAHLVQQHAHGAWRVRLLLDARGHATAQAYALDASPLQVRLQLAESPLELAHSEFVRFKTTRRAHYDAFAPTTPGVFDTLLWNEQGEITECTRGNIALLIDGQWVTPPLHCGLLGGIGRANALRAGRVQEAVVRVADLPRVQAYAFVNSLRGWIAADFDG